MEGRRCEETRGECSVMTDEEIEVMHLQAKERQELPATLEAKREARNRFPPGAFRENMAPLIT